MSATAEATATMVAPADAERPAMALRRMSLADIDDIGPWLIRRLQERYSDATPAQIVGWLRGCLFSNETWFVRTRYTVAMVTVGRFPLETAPVVTEVFVLGHEDHPDDIIAMYQAMKKWAITLGASRMEVLRHSDATQKQIATRIGNPRALTYPKMAVMLT